MNLKELVQNKIVEQGGNLDNFKFKYFEKSPYQKRRFKPEFVEEEVWVHSKAAQAKSKAKHKGYHINNSHFNTPDGYDEPYINSYVEMIIVEDKIYNK